MDCRRRHGSRRAPGARVDHVRRGAARGHRRQQRHRSAARSSRTGTTAAGPAVRWRRRAEPASRTSASRLYTAAGVFSTSTNTVAGGTYSLTPRRGHVDDPRRQPHASRRRAAAAARREPACPCRRSAPTRRPRSRGRGHGPRRRPEPGADRRGQRRGRHHARVADHGDDHAAVDHLRSCSPRRSERHRRRLRLQLRHDREHRRHRAGLAAPVRGERERADRRGRPGAGGSDRGVRDLDLHDPERCREPGTEHRLRQPADRRRRERGRGAHHARERAARDHRHQHDPRRPDPDRERARHGRAAPRPTR